MRETPLIEDDEDIKGDANPGFAQKEKHVEDFEDDRQRHPAREDGYKGELAIEEALEEREGLHGNEKGDAGISEIIVSDVGRKQDKIHYRVYNEIKRSQPICRPEIGKGSRDFGVDVIAEKTEAGQREEAYG